MKLNYEAANTARLALNEQIAKQYPGAAVDMEAMQVQAVREGTVLHLSVLFDDGFVATAQIDLEAAWIH